MQVIKSNIIFILLLFLFLTSCDIKNNRNTFIVKGFPINIELNSTTIDIPINILAPSAITILEDKLLIFDNVKDSLFKVFNLPAIDYLYSYGNLGRGPDEFIFVNFHYIKAINNELELVDNGRLKRLMINQYGFTTKKVITLPRLENPINSPQRINDSIYVADNIFTSDESEHLLINVNMKKIIGKFGRYPNDDLNIKDNVQKYQIYKKFNISSPAGNHFAVFYKYFNRIKIYNSSGDLQKSINLEDCKIQKFSIEHRERNTIYFYTDPFATEKYFYALRINIPGIEYKKNFDTFRPELLIWDWDGNPTARCILDRPITSFTISEKYREIYGVNSMTESKVYKFDLPEL